jgi:hypothetical protein
MARVPPHVAAVLAALKFRGPRREDLRALDDAAWKDLLPLCDQLHLTILLRQNFEADIPNWVRLRIDQNILDNKERFERIRAIYLEIANALQQVGAEHLVLKGFAQSPDFVKDLSSRLQSDLDLYCPPESIHAAQGALSNLGYESIQGTEQQPTDHLPAMLRKTPWQWRGNYFDPELPVGIDLHFRFWNDVNTRLRVEGLDQFWTRRITRHAAFSFPALSTVDGLGYAALHVFHHLQMGGLTPCHVYELAGFLHENADQAQFWEHWRNSHDDSLRRIEAVSFKLASEWFACRLPEAVESEIHDLPGAVQQWFRKYADSPLNSWLSPNKDALWLHLALLETVRDKALVFCSSVLPMRVPPAKAIQRWSWRTYPKFLAYAVSRVSYHLRSAPRTLWDGLRWWWCSRNLGKQL